MKHLIFGLLFSLLGLSTAPLGAATIEELDHVVAIVNDDVITRVELDERLQRIKNQAAQQQQRLPEKEVLERQVLENLVIEKLQLQLAQKVGIRVDDETVNQVINNIASENDLSLPQFQQVLRRDGMSFAAFRENIRNDIIINQLRKRRVEDSVNITEQEVDNYLTNLESRQGLNDEFRLGHILIGVPEGATPDQIEQAANKASQVYNRLRLGADFHQTAVAESSGQNALQGGDLGWRKGGQLPTALAEVIVEMQPGDISEPQRSSSGFHIIKLIDRRSPEQRRIVEQTLARHILIRPNQLISNAEARQRLARLRERILKGESFADLARAHSDDTGSAADGGSLGWVTPGSMVPRFEEQMNRLQPGQISQPFQSRFGWHLVEVISRRKHDDTEQYQRMQARQAIHKRKSDEAIEQWLRQLRAEAYVDYRLNQ
ncbi:peptidylprolyl isomerase [Thiohalophilus sp.]|uniref:peptidylprolyl isomerase n=1 Tax=Thiohalophilus sp. TaxID=3028392 RepID=UPI002ACDE5BA|nr:peptidylprolyl isomerase [Thiohalophilus sp.]MDZ7662017.1 peptidylprolyl isomerase [Thiohalophilus sp.]